MLKKFFCLIAMLLSVITFSLDEKTVIKINLPATPYDKESGDEMLQKFMTEYQDIMDLIDKNDPKAEKPLSNKERKTMDEKLICLFGKKGLYEDFVQRNEDDMSAKIKKYLDSKEGKQMMLDSFIKRLNECKTLKDYSNVFDELANPDRYTKAIPFTKK